MECPKCARYFKVCKDENDTAFKGGKLTILQTESMFKQVVKCVVRCGYIYIYMEGVTNYVSEGRFKKEDCSML